MKCENFEVKSLEIWISKAILDLREKSATVVPLSYMCMYVQYKKSHVV